MQTMAYIDIRTAADAWGVTPRRVQELCKTGAIPGATRFGRAWMIPADTEKPADGRTRAVKSVAPAPHAGFLIPAPRQNPFLIHTDLYHTPGTADALIASFAAYPETAAILRAQFDCRRGNIDAVYAVADHMLENHVGFYSTISAGVALSFCAIWRGDLALWRKARQHIYNAPYKNDNELQMIRFWGAIIESNIHDVRNYPTWFERGDFSCLPADSYCTARVFYAKRLFVSANDLASGKVHYENVEKLGLMHTLPYVLEPMISQAHIEHTVIPEIYLRLMAAVAYHTLGKNALAIPHIDRAIDLCIPDRLYGVLTEYRAVLGNLMDDRLLLRDKSAADAVKRLHKSMHAGWIKLHNQLLERNISAHLTAREREVGRLAAIGLTNAEIAARLNIELSSVKQYIFSAMNKVGAEKRTELGLYI